MKTPSQKLSAEELARRTVERRAVEAVIWGIPAVNFDLMFQSFVRDAKGGVNQILYWARLSDWKNQYLTPNPDTIYFMPFFSTKDVGPVVLEMPPADDGSITGTIMDSWQMALEDVGPAGVDKGKGGKYLITPPDYKDKAPDGYIHLPSQTYQGFALLRSILKSRDKADIAKAVEYGKRIKLYPLSAATKPPMTHFVDAVDVVVSGVIPYDVRFFQSLDRMVQSEPWIERDRAMIDPLKSLGIEKGKPFKPDEQTADILQTAAQEALALFDLRYETSYEPHNEGMRWFLPADKDLMSSVESGFTKTDVYPTDGRGTLFYFAYTSGQAPGRRTVLSVRLPRQGRQSAQRCRRLSSSRAAKAAGAAILVGRALRLRHTRTDPQHAARQPLLAVTRPPNQPRRLSRSLLRAEGARGQGSQLGSDRRQGPIRGALPLLRSRQAAFRQNLGIAGH